MRIANPIAIRGEEAAVSYLAKKGYKIIDRNFRRGYGEIDIIGIKKDGKEQVLVFFEVKTRSSNEFGTPLEQITSWKLRTLIKTAQFYKLLHRELPESLRIDAVSVTISASGSSIEHIENISGF